MDLDLVYEKLKIAFPNTEIEKNHVLAPYTTLKIGGPADIFINTHSSEELLNVLRFLDTEAEAMSFTERNHVPKERVSTVKTSLQGEKTEGNEYRQNLFTRNITMLGNGSNVLIADAGIRGIVIKNSSDKIEILDRENEEKNQTATTISAHRTENEPNQYLNFDKLDYDESSFPKTTVKIDSGVNLSWAINYLIEQGVTGLQWFAYIPGTVGGAVYSNIHGGSHHFSDYVKEVEVFDLNTGSVQTLSVNQLDWAYDFSYFQANPNLVILSVTLNLYLGDQQKAKFTVDEWIKQKSIVQPMNSAGSVFKNPPLEICQKIWGEQKSSGWIIDHELNLKGKIIGNTQISPQHANFIVNLGQAKAQDYLDLLKLVQTETKAKFNLILEPEIKILGL